MESLKQRLSDNLLIIQNENGFLGEASFEWNEPAEEESIKKIEVEIGLLPDAYKEFLRISNGAFMFRDIKYGQWGCHILRVEELLSVTNQVKKRGYKLSESWIVYATWLGDGDLLIFDLSKYNAGERNYIIDGDQGYQTDEWDYIKGDFSKWFDRLIVAQGAKYWRWL